VESIRDVRRLSLVERVAGEAGFAYTRAKARASRGKEERRRDVGAFPGSSGFD